MAGRPTDYTTADFDAKALEYLKCYEKLGSVIPSLSGLALYLGVNRSTIYEWRDKHPTFSDTLDQIMASQEVKALNNGLDGTFNPAITKLVLHNHGYSDKQEVETKMEISTPDMSDADLQAVIDGN